MANIIFGSVFFLFASLFFYLMNFVPGETTGSIFWGNAVIILFMIVGLVIVFSGVKKIIRDKKTDLYGEFCYGLVTAVKFNGTVINGVQQYDAYFKVYLESRGKFIEAHEDIRSEIEKYPLGAFYALRYYEKDINIEYKVPSFDALPQNIKDVFDTGEIIPDDNSWYSNSDNSSSESTYDPDNMYNYDYEK